MEATIRIENEKQGPPKGGFAGAIAGGTDPGDMQRIEVDLRDATGGDLAVNLPLVAEVYRKVFSPAPSAPILITVPDDLTDKVRVHAAPNGAVVMPESAQVHDFSPQPFPEAGDPHPFERPEESETPESVSRDGTGGGRTEVAYDAIHEVLITTPAREATRLTAERIVKALMSGGIIG